MAMNVNTRKVKVLKALDNLSYKQAVYTLLAALEAVAMESDSAEVRQVLADMLAETELKLRINK